MVAQGKLAIADHYSAAARSVLAAADVVLTFPVVTVTISVWSQLHKV